MRKINEYIAAYNYLNDLQAEFLEHSEAYSDDLLKYMEIALDVLDEKITNNFKFR